MTKKMKTKVLLIIGLHSKGWMCDKLGISYNTLRERLATESWKKSEIYMIETLYEENKHLF
jgi:hypothetical protein